MFNNVYTHLKLNALYTLKGIETEIKIRLQVEYGCYYELNITSY